MNSDTSLQSIILGIDPGYDRIGWAVGKVEKGKLSMLEYNCIETNRKKTLSERYLEIAQALEAIIFRHQPTHLAIEQLFFAKNQTTALKVSEARGVILVTCARHSLMVAEYNPLHIKQAVTGYGRADKAAMNKMLRLQLKLEDTAIRDDTMDALGLVLTHSVLAPQTLRQSALQ